MDPRQFIKLILPRDITQLFVSAKEHLNLLENTVCLIRLENPNNKKLKRMIFSSIQVCDILTEETKQPKSCSSCNSFDTMLIFVETENFIYVNSNRDNKRQVNMLITFISLSFIQVHNIL